MAGLPPASCGTSEVELTNCALPRLAGSCVGVSTGVAGNAEFCVAAAAPIDSGRGHRHDVGGELPVQDLRVARPLADSTRHIAVHAPAGHHRVDGDRQAT